MTFKHPEPNPGTGARHVLTALVSHCQEGDGKENDMRVRNTVKGREGQIVGRENGLTRGRERISNKRLLCFLLRTT